MKSFIGKLIFLENHDDCLCYPENAGGGFKRLFIKIDDRSSEYDNIYESGRDGAYIYEELFIAFGTDIKVYTVGPMFSHAKGKEVCYSVILNYEENNAESHQRYLYSNRNMDREVKKKRLGKVVASDLLEQTLKDVKYSYSRNSSEIKKKNTANEYYDNNRINKSELSNQIKRIVSNIRLRRKASISRKQYRALSNCDPIYYSEKNINENKYKLEIFVSRGINNNVDKNIGNLRVLARKAITMTAITNTKFFIVCGKAERVIPTGKS
ncbi:hypothetical protein FG386_000692 [Cryptosporidium ryanae]|uniref:uncharacterized protein n=1 Tax=Cryptosporidium ryanae TaxID=515981 RepID=UPI00351A4D26|nr:hypothetical protein FG386_000692 [Cryptosporidium ryanae]